MINKNCRDFKIANNENVIFTTNVRLYKNKPVLVVGNNKVVFLNAGDFAKAQAYIHETMDVLAEGFLVKVHSDSKIYTFHHDFDGFCFEKDDTMESLIELGEQQDKDDKDFYQIKGKLNFFSLSNSIDRL